MKLNLTIGCVCDNLSADGVREVDMTSRQREDTWNKIVSFLSQCDADEYHLNLLMEFLCKTYGQYECDEHICECCGDYVEYWDLEI